MTRYKELEEALSTIDLLKKPGRVIVIAFRNKNKPRDAQVSIDIVGPRGTTTDRGGVTAFEIEASVNGETLVEALNTSVHDLDPRDSGYKGRNILTEGASPSMLIARSTPRRQVMSTLRALRDTLLESMRAAGDVGDYAKAAALRQKSVGVNLAIKTLSRDT